MIVVDELASNTLFSGVGSEDAVVVDLVPVVHVLDHSPVVENEVRGQVGDEVFYLYPGAHVDAVLVARKLVDSGDVAVLLVPLPEGYAYANVFRVGYSPYSVSAVEVESPVTVLGCLGIVSV